MSTRNQKLSRHRLAKKLRSRHHSVVVTSVAKSEAVATSLAKERRSRHHSMVATSVALKGGRDIIQLSQHHL